MVVEIPLRQCLLCLAQFACLNVSINILGGVFQSVITAAVSDCAWIKTFTQQKLLLQTDDNLLYAVNSHETVQQHQMNSWFQCVMAIQNCCKCSCLTHGIAL